MSNEEAHRLAREKGVSGWLYALVRGVVAPLFRLYFRMHVSGAEHIPADFGVGVHTITIPMAPSSAPRRIDVT